MSRGITETDVWNACDVLLMEGARPTIERVRLKIGRGSPNTVSPHLEAWFKHLGRRIQDPGGFAAPPDVPEPVLQAAQHFWETALAQTRHDFDQRLAQAMAAAVENVEAEKERATIAEAAAYEAAGKVTRLQLELGERAAVLEREKMARAALEAYLAEARQQIQELQRRLAQRAADLAEVRESARRDVATAHERSAAAERRAALEIEAERSARAKADKRTEGLERKLEALHAEARTEQARQVQLSARLQAELNQRVEEEQRQQVREAHLAQQVLALEEKLSQQTHEVHIVRAQADLAERLVASLKPAGRAGLRRRTRLKPAPRE